MRADSSRISWNHQQKAEQFQVSKQCEWQRLVQHGRDFLLAQVKLFIQSTESQHYKRPRTPTALADSPSTACVVCNGVGCTELKPF